MSKEDWGLVTLPTSGDPEKIAIGRLKAASDMAHSIATQLKDLYGPGVGGKLIDDLEKG